MICLLNARPYFTNSIYEGIDLFMAKPFMFWLSITIIPQPYILNPSSLNKIILKKTIVKGVYETKTTVIIM